ncbi:MAG: hypothetical protein NZM04_04460 [Methylacidiphilales bacterium]|nr:hypothetical protein [Candidatus Methylacidiphilales bacterium]
MRPAPDILDQIDAFFISDECEQLIKFDDRLVVGWGPWDVGGQGKFRECLNPNTCVVPRIALITRMRLLEGLPPIPALHKGITRPP